MESKNPSARRRMGDVGAEDEIRTRDPHLGKVMLYQLSYFRVFPCEGLQS